MVLPEISKYQLPHWQRIKYFNKVKSVKSKEKREEEIMPYIVKGKTASQRYSSFTDRTVENCDSFPQSCSVDEGESGSLRAKLAWLVEEHADMLRFLHDEMDNLRDVNKNLQIENAKLLEGDKDAKTKVKEQLNPKEHIPSTKSAEERAKEIQRLSSLYQETQKLTQLLRMEKLNNRSVESALSLAKAEIQTLKRSKLHKSLSVHNNDLGLPKYMIIGEMRVAFQPFLVILGNAKPHRPNRKEYEMLIAHLVALLSSANPEINRCSKAKNSSKNYQNTTKKPHKYTLPPLETMSHSTARLSEPKAATITVLPSITNDVVSNVKSPYQAGYRVKRARLADLLKK